MRLLSSICAAALLAGCSVIQFRLHKPEPVLLHAYSQLPTSSAAIKNLNRDSDGDEWMVGGLILPEKQELEQVPVLQLPARARGLAGALPRMVDNSAKKYWRGIFTQKHGSCAQASAIAYVYGYEVNRLRNLDASDPVNKYPTHWTYNFVNAGYDRGSWMMWGWEVGKSLGIPSAKAYGTETGYDLQYWPSDYAVYEDAIDNRVDRYFIMRIDTKATLEQFKRYLYNHGADGQDGGVVSIAAGWSTGYTEARIPEGQHGAGKKLIQSFGAQVNHAVTIVGYDDDICHDFNGDGICTDDVDLNGDEKIDLKDAEKGAFIMANSWGVGWGNDGYIYIPYRLGAVGHAEGGIYMSYVYGVIPRVDKDKQLVLRLAMQHDKRNKLRLMSTYERAKDNKKPSNYSYYGLQASGGNYPLNGKDGGAVTFGLDLDLLLGNENLKQTLDIGSVVDAASGGVGKILSMEIVDYVNNKVTVADARDVNIETGRNIVRTLWDSDADPDPEPLKPCRVGPVANAGADMMVGEYCALTLDATGSYDADGKIVKYSWSQLYGPQKLEIKNADQVAATILIPVVKADERYAFRITITDNDGFVTSDSVDVLVIDRFE